MRQYRAIPTDGKDFIYGWYKEDTYGKPKILAENPENHFLCWFFVIPETVGQQIGIKSENKKEIYAGDIVEFDNTEIGGKKYVGEIVWNNDQTLSSLEFGLWTKNRYLRTDFLGKIKIIGNIHQNSKLLEKS